MHSYWWPGVAVLVTAGLLLLVGRVGPGLLLLAVAWYLERVITAQETKT